MIKTKRDRSNKQERRVAKEVGGKVTIASGAFWCAKGDVRSTDYLIECKTTLKDFYTLKLSTWYKIEEEACNDGFRIPVMCVDLEDGKSRRAIFKLSDFSEHSVNLSIKVSGLFYEDTAEFVSCKGRKQVKIDSTDTVYEIDTKYVLCSCDWDTFKKMYLEPPTGKE